MATMNQDLTPKLLEIQHDVIPNAKTIAALFNPTNPTNPVYIDKLQAAAGAIGITVLPVELKAADALDAVFASIAARHPDALHIVADSGIIDLADRIAASALA
jgi:putative ABC transport system substrate-binding protein